MPEFRKTCDVFQGFHFKNDKQSTIGHITHLAIGGTVFPADLACKDPMNPQRGLEVVGICSGVSWELGVTDAVYLAGQISTSARQTISQLVLNPEASSEVVVQFTVYEYDPASKAYFKALDCADADLSGVVEKRGEELDLCVSDDAATEVQSPQNYAFSIGIKPPSWPQTLTVAISSNAKLVKAWGLRLA